MLNVCKYVNKSRKSYCPNNFVIYCMFVSRHLTNITARGLLLCAIHTEKYKINRIVFISACSRAFFDVVVLGIDVSDVSDVCVCVFCRFSLVFHANYSSLKKVKISYMYSLYMDIVVVVCVFLCVSDVFSLIYI